MAYIKMGKFTCIRPGLALASLFGWLLSFPMFGRLLFDIAGERALYLGLVFLLSHALGYFSLQKLSSKAATARVAVRAAGMTISVLTLLYAFLFTHYIMDFFIMMTMGVASAYLVLAWVTGFISNSRPLLNLAVAMGGANVINAVINFPWILPLNLSFILVSLLALCSTFLVQPGTEKGLPLVSVFKQDSVKMITALGAFVVAIYFVGGIWYETVVMQFPVDSHWGAFISSVLYVAGIVFLVYLATRGQPGNLALYGLSALGLGLLVNLTGLAGFFPTLAYYAGLNFGMAAADLFLWYALWVLGKLYGGRRVFGLGLGFSLVLIALSVVVSTAGWAASSPALLYIGALTLLFLAIPLIFRYPFQLADLPPANMDVSVGADAELAEILTPPEILTPQERQIYALLMQGSTNDEIAGAMYISKHTVKFHGRNIFRKLGVKNRKELLSRYFTLKENLPNNNGIE